MNTIFNVGGGASSGFAASSFAVEICWNTASRVAELESDKIDGNMRVVAVPHVFFVRGGLQTLVAVRVRLIYSENPTPLLVGHPKLSLEKSYRCNAMKKSLNLETSRRIQQCAKSGISTILGC